MAIKLTELNGGKVLEVQASGKLIHQDYEVFVPVFERLLQQHGKIAVLFEMVNFQGWETSAAWDDIKFDVKHFSDVTKFAMVGDKKWEKDMTAFASPFTAAKVQYFDLTDIEKAKVWVAAGA